AGNLLKLPFSVPVKGDLGADGVMVALRALKVELNPFFSRIDVISINQQRPVLVGSHYVKCPIIPKISYRHGPPVVPVCHANCAGYIFKLSSPVVNPDAFMLVSGKTASVECWPVPGIVNNGAVAGSHFSKVIPITSIAVERNIAI